MSVAAALGSSFGRGYGPRLKLDWSLGAFADRETGDISPLFVFFDARNTGSIEAELVHLSVEVKGRRLDLTDHLGGERDLPCKLAPGEATRFWLRARDLANKLKDEGQTGGPRVKLVVEDKLGNEYAKRFRFRVDQYLLLKDEG
ncbi:MAG: hypothetical protein ACRDTR_11705 [Rubrobacter sp.]